MIEADEFEGSARAHPPARGAAQPPGLDGGATRPGPDGSRRERRRTVGGFL